MTDTWLFDSAQTASGTKLVLLHDIDDEEGTPNPQSESRFNAYPFPVLAGSADRTHFGPTVHLEATQKRDPAGNVTQLVDLGVIAGGPVDTSITYTATWPSAGSNWIWRASDTTAGAGTTCTTDPAWYNSFPGLNTKAPLGSPCSILVRRAGSSSGEPATNKENLMTSLSDAVLWLQGAAEDELSMKTMCVREPWSARADAHVVPVDEEGCLPPDALTHGYKYFLEASVAREVLDVLRSRPSGSTIDDACTLLIFYAENDAYPDWVYR